VEAFVPGTASPYVLAVIDLRKVDMFGPKFNRTAAIPLGQYNCQLPKQGEGAEVRIYVCDDTDDNDRCSDEAEEALLGHVVPAHQAEHFPSAVAIPTLSCQ
jgi:hypothetical protein